MRVNDFCGKPRVGESIRVAQNQNIELLKPFSQIESLESTMIDRGTSTTPSCDSYSSQSSYWQ